jgi:uncharacterized LabA/DUF88 family protein
MLFIDGENLAIRWKNQLGDRPVPDHVKYRHDIFVWTDLLNMTRHLHCNIIRRHYYTSSRGDETDRSAIVDELKAIGIESPYVYHRQKAKNSKRVDIKLSVDMLTHAYQNNYDVAVLIAGDEDYVPLVEAVKNAGRRVFVWFVKDGLSPHIERSADYFYDLELALCNPDARRYFP